MGLALPASNTFKFDLIIIGGWEGTHVQYTEWYPSKVYYCRTWSSTLHLNEYTDTISILNKCRKVRQDGPHSPCMYTFNAGRERPILAWSNFTMGILVPNI